MRHGLSALIALQALRSLTWGLHAQSLPMGQELYLNSALEALAHT